MRGRGAASPSFVAAGLLKFPESCAIPRHQVAFSCQGVFSMSRIAAGPAAEGAEQRQESSGKERDGRTAAGAAGGADDLRIQHAGQCGDAGPLQRRETDIGQWPRALLALSGLAAGFVFDWKRVHGADHVLRDDALHHRLVTAAGWPFGWGCCWQALWERRRSRCTNSGKAAAMIPPLRSEEPFL